MKGILSALVLVLLSASLFAQLDNFFLNSLFPAASVKKEVNSTVTVISAQSSPLCNSGMVQFCKYEKKIVTDVFLNRTIFHPYHDQGIIELESGNRYDEDDRFTLANYNTTRLEACGAKAKNITDIFKCTIEFNRQNEKSGGNCRTSTSAFKIAFLRSPLFKQNKSEGENFTLKKVYVWDEGNYNAHRFITLENSNGVYVLDALWCTNGSVESCIKQSTKKFYEDKKSMNYRGIVYKEDKIY